MITAIALAFVIAIAFAAAVAAGDSLVRLAVVAAAGIGTIVALFYLVVVRANPSGDGWANRSQVWGHWVPAWQANLEFWSVIVWLAAIAVARRIRASRRVSALRV